MSAARRSLVGLLLVAALIAAVACAFDPHRVVHRPKRALGFVARDDMKKMVVGVTASNLRSEPKAMQAVDYGIDDLQLSQLVFNEPVNVLQETNNDWAQVAALQQPNLVNGKWQPYVGYMNVSDLVPVNEFPNYTLVVASPVADLYSKSCHLFGCVSEDVRLQLSIGTWLESVGSAPQYGWWQVKVPPNQMGWIRASDVSTLASETALGGDALRQALVSTVYEMLGWYYFWGGRSSFVSDLWERKVVLTGVDCSGLVGTAYRAHGRLLPRDASPMYSKSQNISSPTDIMPGDLFFFAHPSNPTHMYHVMMYIGNEQLAESSFDEPNYNGTMVVDVVDRFGMEVADLKYGAPVNGVGVNGSYLYWGRYVE